MPKPNKDHTYPSHVLEEEIRKRGYPIRCMWEMKGPPNTRIIWVVCYLCEGTIVLVTTYEGGSWEAFTPNQDGKIEATVEDVIARCCRKVPT